MENPFVDTDYGRTDCMDGDKNCPDNIYGGEYWTIDGKKKLHETDHGYKTGNK